MTIQWLTKKLLNISLSLNHIIDQFENIGMTVNDEAFDGHLYSNLTETADILSALLDIPEKEKDDFCNQITNVKADNIDTLTTAITDGKDFPDMPNGIYTIMMTEKLEPHSDYGCTKIVGYYFEKDKDRALSMIHRNATDLCETCYQYAVMEYIQPGIAAYSLDHEAQWFKYDSETNRYIEIETPEFDKIYTNRTIG